MWRLRPQKISQSDILHGFPFHFYVYLATTPDTYTAEIVDLVHATFDWNQLLDPNGDDEDADGDGLPDEVFTRL